MQTVDASVILDDAYQLIGWDQTQLETRQEQQARMAMSMALQEMWERWWWEELMICQRVQFWNSYRADTIYNGYFTSGSTNTFVYWPQTDGYYQAVQMANFGIAPTDASGNLATANWFQWRACPYPNASAFPTNQNTLFGQVDYPSWNATQSYGLGDIANWFAPFFDDPTQFQQANFVSIIAANLGNQPVWVDIIVGDPAIQWFQIANWQPNVTTAAVNPVYGDIRSVSSTDPRASTPALRFHFDANGNVYGLNVGKPWVWSRRVTPVLTGDAYDPTVNYTATAASDLVFDS